VEIQKVSIASDIEKRLCSGPGRQDFISHLGT